MLGAYTGSLPVFLGATSGFFVMGVVADVAKDQFGQLFRLTPPPPTRNVKFFLFQN